MRCIEAELNKSFSKPILALKNFEIDKMWFEIKNKVPILILINYSDNFYFSILINFFILSDEKWGVIVCVWLAQWLSLRLLPPRDMSSPLMKIDEILTFMLFVASGRHKNVSSFLFIIMEFREVIRRGWVMKFGENLQGHITHEWRTQVRNSKFYEIGSKI